MTLRTPSEDQRQAIEEAHWVGPREPPGSRSRADSNAWHMPRQPLQQVILYDM